MAGLSLKTAAAYFAHDEFEGWDADEDEFEDAFVGRLYRVDRFRSLYHKSTRRQKLGVGQDAAIPASRVVRRKTDGEVFLVSLLGEQEFWQGAQHYETVFTLHRAIPKEGGLASLISVEVVPSFPIVQNNLGPVVFLDPVFCYVDSELRSTKTPEDTVEIQSGEYVFTISENVEPRNGDYFLLNGRHFRVVQVFEDSGFTSARTIQEEPSYKTLSFQFVSGKGSYDPTTGQATKTTSTRLVSAILETDSSDRGRISQEYKQTITAYIYKRHIGFEPKVGTVVSYDGSTYKVTSVTQKNIDLQWKLELSI